MRRVGPGTRANPSVLDAIGCHGHDTRHPHPSIIFRRNRQPPSQMSTCHSHQWQHATMVLGLGSIHQTSHSSHPHTDHTAKGMIVLSFGNQPLLNPNTIAWLPPSLQRIWPRLSRPLLMLGQTPPKRCMGLVYWPTMPFVTVERYLTCNRHQLVPF